MRIRNSTSTIHKTWPKNLQLPERTSNNMKKTIHTEGQQMFFSKLEVTGPVEAQRISQDVKLNCLNDKNAN